MREAQHENEERLIKRLMTLSQEGSACCGEFLATLDSLHRTDLYTGLIIERLHRKMRIVEQLHKEADENWNQTFYLLYFRTLGDNLNRENYLELARRVPYRILLRERLADRAIEAMLIGASGLIDLYPDDEYTIGLRREFEHLRAKYQIEKMEASSWVLREVRPANHPILRLAQAAEFFRQDELLFDRVLSCHSKQEIERLFCIEAGSYWFRHDIPGSEGRERPKRIGAFKANIIGINLVVVLQFAYGLICGIEPMKERALELLEQLPAEDNRYMRLWQSTGVKARDAFESQALLQLHTEHCLQKACRECPLARRMVARL